MIYAQLKQNMELPQIRPYTSRYTGSIYNSTNPEYTERFNCFEELLDFRFQIACIRAEGYYVVFDEDPDATECIIDDKGTLDNHPVLSNPRAEINREFYYLAASNWNPDTKYTKLY